MTVSLYDISIPVLRRGLDNMAACLTKGADYLAIEGLPESTLLEAKLAEDMYAFPRQIQIATDAAKGAGARLSNSDAPSYADTEATIAELQARIAKTSAYLDSIDPAAIIGREDAEIVMKLPSQEIRFTGLSYVQNFVVPNFFFHATASYAIMRHIGVPIGKLDYLGGI
jgi:hypothetical protein